MNIGRERFSDPRYQAGQLAVKKLAEEGTPWKDEALVIGLTGSIASGKTTVADYLQEKGATLVDGDIISRELVEPGQPVYQEILREFGSDIAHPDGGLDRKKLGKKVFGNDQALLKLNSIMHPPIWREMTRQVMAAALQTDVVVMVMPLLLEHAAESLVEQVWVTDVSKETQLERLMARDNSSRDRALARIAAQMGPDEKRQLGQVLIDNNGTLQETLQNVDAAWEKHIQANRGS